MHALIIEDEAMTALWIEDLLIDLGFDSFDIAVTEAEAVAAAIANRPNLITSDVHLLAGNGIDAVETICLDCAVPIVFVTSSAGRVRARYSAAIIVEKPFQTAVFRQGIATARDSLAGAATLRWH